MLFGNELFCILKMLSLFCNVLVGGFFNIIFIFSSAIFLGTGKTQTGVKVAYLFAQMNRNCASAGAVRRQVLYCGPSNGAIDVAASTYTDNTFVTFLPVVRLRRCSGRWVLPVNVPSQLSILSICQFNSIHFCAFDLNFQDNVPTKSRWCYQLELYM